MWRKAEMNHVDVQEQSEMEEKHGGGEDMEKYV